MNNYISLTVSLVANLFGGIFKKHLSDRYENTAFSRHFYNTGVSIVCAVALLVVGGVPKASMFTVFMGLAFGFITALQQIANLKALETGPFSYTTVIVSLSTIIPTLSGVLFWNETINIKQIIAIILMFMCFILSVNFEKEHKKASVKWILFCLVTFVCTGLIGVMQKLHQSSDYKSELDAFLIIAFAVSAVYSLANCLILKIVSKQQNAVSTQNSAEAKSITGLIPVVIIIISGICVAVNNKLNLYLSGVMDSAVFFPVVNGGGLILTTLAALFLFKERLNKKQWLGIAVGIISVLLFCI